MTRILAYCINAEEHLVFTKGLSAVEEPDIWARTLDDQISLWIDVGEPAVDRIKKATHRATKVNVYSFNSKSDVWWIQGQSKINKLKAAIFQFQWESMQLAAALLQRTMDFSITITGDSAYVATELGECEISWITLQSAKKGNLIL